MFWRDEDGELNDYTIVNKTESINMRGFKVEPVNIDDSFMTYNEYNGNLTMKGLNHYTTGKYLLSFRITDYLNESEIRYFEVNFVAAN